MYQLVYYYKETTFTSTFSTGFEREYHSDEFRLRRNALHYLLDIVQSEYRAEGYGTEQIVGGINCYKSKKTENGDKKIIEVKIKVEKVK